MITLKKYREKIKSGKGKNSSTKKGSSNTHPFLSARRHRGKDQSTKYKSLNYMKLIIVVKSCLLSDAVLF